MLNMVKIDIAALQAAFARTEQAEKPNQPEPA
jgi:hypothetical protein